MAVVLTPVQTKQIRINIHKRNNTKHSKYQYTYYALPKHSHSVSKKPHIQSPTKITVIILTGENGTILSKTCSNAIFSTTHLTWTDRGSNPVSCGEKLAINCLGHGAVFSNTEIRTHFIRNPTYEGWNFNSGNYLFTTDTK